MSDWIEKEREREEKSQKQFRADYNLKDALPRSTIVRKDKEKKPYKNSRTKYFLLIICIITIVVLVGVKLIVLPMLITAETDNPILQALKNSSNRVDSALENIVLIVVIILILGFFLSLIWKELGSVFGGMSKEQIISNMKETLKIYFADMENGHTLDTIWDMVVNGQNVDKEIEPSKDQDNQDNPLS